jgi:glycosyltransferase involved in cell wall biosynthesis
MPALSILFTNNTLAQRCGSELWVRDICRALVARGHRPIAFSLVIGPIAEELRAATVPVVSTLDDIGFVPDLIHGHHHVETLMAALHFPGVPIVHFCHGWSPWEERPLIHPSIARYVAVDETCADRLTAENGIGRDRVDLLLNFVDMKRFAPRDPLPARPRRALVFNNTAGEDGYAAIIREACREQGIELEIAGMRSGRIHDHPELLLPQFDLVFAKARAALEAMAVGCSVILADHSGCGPIVAEQGFDEMRARNFGVRCLQQPHSVDWYRTQIAAYDAAAAGRISRRVRDDADLERAADRLLEIYARAMTGHRQHPVAGTTAEECTRWAAESQRAAARHIGSVALPFKRFHEVQARSAALSAELAAASTVREHIVRERQQLVTEVAALTGQAVAVGRVNQQLRDEIAAARDLTQRWVEERRALERLVAEYRALPTLKLRDRLLRIPILGVAVQRIARALR